MWLWGKVLVEFRDPGAIPAQSHDPPNMGAGNSHMTQMVLEGHVGHLTVPLITLIHPTLYGLMGLGSKVKPVEPLHWKL